MYILFHWCYFRHDSSILFIPPEIYKAMEMYVRHPSWSVRLCGPCWPQGDHWLVALQLSVAPGFCFCSVVLWITFHMHEIGICQIILKKKQRNPFFIDFTYGLNQGAAVVCLAWLTQLLFILKTQFWNLWRFMKHTGQVYTKKLPLIHWKRKGLEQHLNQT